MGCAEYGGSLEMGSLSDLSSQCGSCASGRHVREEAMEGCASKCEQDHYIATHSDKSGAVPLTGLEQWDCATQRSPPRRLFNGSLYSLADLEEWYGRERGRRVWGDAPLADVSQVLCLIADPERRVALHLAHLRQCPKIRTPCCGVSFCFRCQVGTWHEGTTCEEFQRRTLVVEVQCCPSCGVPTQRTEGCSSMVCLCGEHW